MNNGMAEERSSPIEGQSVILSIVPDGSLVDEGQLVCQLDPAQLREKLAQIRVVVESQSPRLVAPAALPDAVAQQLRNVVGRYQVGQFRLGQRR